MVDSKSINFRYAFIAVYILGFLARNFTANNNYSGQDSRTIALINTYVDDWWFFLTLDLAFFIPIFFFDRRRAVGVLRGTGGRTLAIGLTASVVLGVLLPSHYLGDLSFEGTPLPILDQTAWIATQVFTYFMVVFACGDERSPDQTRPDQTRPHSDNMLGEHAIS
ncbi:MAG: hypothetical protein EP347_12055 [Alphaproteobacteria bacterium]|nr:MAG: hypothetical protein EP347_12055 [Alphaproteobacteria bacterium]